MKETPDHPANLDVLIQNFDCALSHPDANDLNWGYRTKRVDGLIPFNKRSVIIM